MGNIFNNDFRDFINALNKCNVQYILVGGYSVILHGYNRTTGDMDIWVNKTEENYQKLQKAFGIFGMSLFDMTKENFLGNPNIDVFSFGRPPTSIDIITKLKGLEFEEAFTSAIYYYQEGLDIRYLDLQNLIKAKQASGRAKDKDDIENLI